MRLNFLITIFLFSDFCAIGQQSTRSISGIVVDQSSGAPIHSASVLLTGEYQKGSVTDSTGHFTFAGIPTGRYNLKVSLVGYQTSLVREILVSSSKEVFLTIPMKEQSSMLKEVMVHPNTNKEKPLNNMALTSARMLSVEEASRYAGGFDDPARLVSSFAGVSSNTGNNGIVVRGNAPQYLQWKMEGIEIPNPNHFADVITFGGGGLTALSSQMLSNSDFFTGAFPAEYSNAVSGVFDIFMRKGNNKKRESTFQIGLIGIDISSEGPLKKESRSSYLFNYRYSTLALAAPLLPEDAGGVRYQDLSFKFNFPTKRAGTFSLWGIGLKDRSGEKAKKDSLKWEYNKDREEQKIDQYMAAIGFSNQFFFNNRTFIKTSIAATMNKLDFTTDSLNDQLVFAPQNRIKNTNWNFILSSFLNTKFGPEHTNKTGFTLTGLTYNMRTKDRVQTLSPITTLISGNGFSTLLSAYTSSAFNYSNRLSLTLGLTGQVFTFNNKYSVEPRAGFKWQAGENWSIGGAYGLHSRLERLSYYFVRSENDNSLLNKNLGFTKAHHFVLSFDQNLSENLHLKIEPYYQRLFDVPVVADSSFSLINMQDDWFFSEKLENSGKGRTYGIDFTLEKYLSQKYYFMITASLFDTKYLGGDKKWYDSRFNRKYSVNLLFGKEWHSGKNKQNIWSFNTRFAFQGGDRYSPLNQEASLEAKDIVYNEKRAFQEQFPASFVTHLTASYKINKNNRSREISLKVINLTGQKDYYGYHYNLVSNSLTRNDQATFIPNISYKIDF